MRSSANDRSKNVVGVNRKRQSLVVAQFEDGPLMAACTTRNALTFKSIGLSSPLG
jgi:hypothetical protein